MHRHQTTGVVMPTCDEIRTMIAIGDHDTPLVQTHIADCPQCRSYAVVDAKFNHYIANKLLITPSARLTEQLLAMATDHASPVPPFARRWWVIPSIIAICAVALGFSVLLSAHIVLLFGSTSQYHTYAQAIIAFPDQLYAQVAQFPALGSALVTFNTLRIQLIVVLLVGLLFFGYYNQRGARASKRNK